jgi:plasmid stabilization system protein ParE
VSRSVVFRSSAVADIEEAYVWYESHRRGLGLQFMAELRKIEASIAERPEMFDVIRGQVRRAILRRFPYGVFFVVRPEFISVVAVLHHARDPRNWRRRASSES